MPRIVFIMAAFFVSTAAAAHPGHDQGNGLAHDLIEPVHVLGGVALVVIVLLAARVLHHAGARPSTSGI